MGLDITAHRQVQKVDKSTIALDEDGYPEDYDNYSIFYVVEHYADRAPEIESDAVYTSTETYGFRAGSYSGYNTWRNELAKMAGYPEIKGRYDEGAWEEESGPFLDLINYSDCEGVIGTGVCKNLLADFLAFDAQAQTHNSPNGEYFYEVYKEFTQGLTLAADNGLLHFH